jgi:DNA ligase-1
VQYETVAETYRDLERATGRLQLIERLATLLAQTPAELRPTITYLCQAQIAPEFAGVQLGLAEKLAARALAEAAGATGERVLAVLRVTGDLGQTAEQLLGEAAAVRPATLEVGRVVDTLHAIAASAGPGSQTQKLTLLVELLGAATPLEARYLLRLVTGTLRLGMGTPTILDALAEVYAGGRAARPVLERAYNICCDIGLVAATLAAGGPAAVERLHVRPGNPIRAMLAQRMSDAAEILDKLGGSCAAEYKYDGMRIQAHRTDEGQVELFTRRLDRVSDQFPDVVELLAGGLRPRTAILGGALLLATYDPATDSFPTICKCGTGFSDAELAALPARLAPLARADRPARVDTRQPADVWFEPGVVIEVLAAELTLSPNHTTGWGQVKDAAGLALRFPRFTGRYRDDKAPEDATTVAEAVQLYRSARRAPVGG